MKTTLLNGSNLRNRLIPVLILAASFALQTVQAQLNSGQIPSNPLNESLVGQRYRALKVNGSTGNKEVYTGVTDLGNPSNRSDNDLNYKTSLNFTISYDAANDWFINVTKIDSSTKTLITTIDNAVINAGKTNPISALNYLQIEAKNQNNTSAIALSNLKLNGNSIAGTYTNLASGSQFWYMYATSLGSGFSLSGTITLAGNFGNSPDMNMVEFQFGYSPLALSLPLNWGDVTARKVSNGVNVRWSTLQEVNTDRFVVERSADNQNFTAVSSVNAQGNSNAVNWYEITDANPFKGINYYRIKEIDLDGHIYYSKTVAISLQSKSNMLVSANSNTLQVQFNTTMVRTVQIYNSNGTSIRKEISSGSIYTTDINSLPRGIYIVRVTGPDGIPETQKFFR